MRSGGTNNWAASFPPDVCSAAYLLRSAFPMAPSPPRLRILSGTTPHSPCSFLSLLFLLLLLLLLLLSFLPSLSSAASPQPANLALLPVLKSSVYYLSTHLRSLHSILHLLSGHPPLREKRKKEKGKRNITKSRGGRSKNKRQQGNWE